MTHHEQYIYNSLNLHIPTSIDIVAQDFYDGTGGTSNDLDIALNGLSSQGKILNDGENITRI